MSFIRIRPALALLAPALTAVALAGATTTAGATAPAAKHHSCQDGAGPLDAASFTGLAQFTVRHASGASGSGTASFTEDTAKHHRMTLIGRIAR